jgi:hypothetical protein
MQHGMASPVMFELLLKPPELEVALHRVADWHMRLATDSSGEEAHGNEDTVAARHEQAEKWIKQSVFIKIFSICTPDMAKGDIRNR